MYLSRKAAAISAAVVGVGLALPMAQPATAVGAVPLGLRTGVTAEDPAPGGTTYPVGFNFTNQTPYTLHIWPEVASSRDECWNSIENDMVLAPGQTGGNRAWTQLRHLHCFIGFRVAIKGPMGEYQLKPPQPWYVGRASELLTTMTYYFPEEPDSVNWMWAPWGFWTLPEKAMGVDTTKNRVVYFRVSDDNNVQDKCKDKNGSGAYCRVTITTTGPGAPRTPELFEKGAPVGQQKASLSEDPKSWPTIAAIQAEGCRSRGVIESRCAKVDGPVDFSELTVQEKEFKVDTNNIKVVGEIVSNGDWTNDMDKENTFTFRREVSVGEESVTSSTSSHSIGGSVKVGGQKTWKTPVASGGITFEVTVKTNHVWESTESKTNSKTDTKTLEYNIKVPKRSVLHYRILQNAITKTASDYTANVVIGPDDGSAQQITSPIFSNSLISPVDEQPCLAVAIGNEKVPFSLLELRKWVQDTGGFGDSARAKRFLRNAANFTSSGQCPGMPAAFPSQAKFQGSGQVVDEQHGMNAACTYATPIKKSGPSIDPPRGGVQAATEPPQGEPVTIDNTPPKCDGPKQGMAAAFDASMVPFKAQGIVKGTRYGDLLMSKDRSGVVLRGGSSRDILEGGSGVNNTLDGQAGDDVLKGGPTSEILRGGTGSDYLAGGKGDDELVDSSGVGNFLAGGGGRDRLTTMRGSSALDGGPGADTLVAVKGEVGMSGGKGNDQYRVRRGAKNVSVTERPNSGRDVVQSWRSFTLPMSFEELRLKGSGDLKAKASTVDQKIVGNSGNNVLRSEVGFSRLIGGAGNDKIYLPSIGFDKVTGGPGKDKFLLTGTPSAIDTQAGAKPKLSHKITDFTPGKDKLVLSTKVHGPEVAQLRKVFRVFDPSGTPDRTPKGSGPALVVNTKTGVVRYDSDDAGRTPERVLVQLPKGMSLTAQDIQIR